MDNLMFAADEISENSQVPRQGQGERDGGHGKGVLCRRVGIFLGRHQRYI